MYNIELLIITITIFIIFNFLIFIIGINNIIACDKIASNELSAYKFISKLDSEGDIDENFYMPGDITIDIDGYIFITDLGSNCVKKFDSEGNFIAKFGSTGNQNGQFNCPIGIAANKDKFIFVLDSTNNCIQKFDNNGNFIQKWDRYDVDYKKLASPMGITIDPQDFVYVTNNNQIIKFDSEGNFISVDFIYENNNDYLYYFTSISSDLCGTIFVIYQEANYLIPFGEGFLEPTYNLNFTFSILNFSPSGKLRAKWNKYALRNYNFEKIVDITTDFQGNVYIVNIENHCIQKFTNEGIFITKWGSFGTKDGQFNNPTGIAVDAEGNVYVVDSGNHRIQKFAPNPDYKPENPIQKEE